MDLLDANLSILLPYIKYFNGSELQRASLHSRSLLLHTLVMSVWSTFLLFPAFSPVFDRPPDMYLWLPFAWRLLASTHLSIYVLLCLTCSMLLAFSFSEFCWLLRFLPLASLCSVDAITVLRSTHPLGTFEGWIIVWLVNQFINSVCHAYYDLEMVWGLKIHQGTEFVSIQRET